MHRWRTWIVVLLAGAALGCQEYASQMGEDDPAPPPGLGADLLQIHLANQTLEPLGYEFLALDGAPVTAEEVTQVVAAAFPDHYIAECQAMQQYLQFWACTEGIGDFAALALVDEGSGTLVYAGSIVWAGTGSRMYPDPLQPAEDLDATAAVLAPQPPLIHFVLQSEPESLGMAAMDTVREMDLVQRWLDGAVYEALVYVHTYSVGGGDPADWAVIVFLVKR